MNTTDPESVRDIASALDGLKVVDLGHGMATALIAKMLGEMGASVGRFEPVSGDPFRAFYPGYDVWHRRAIITRCAAPEAPEVETALAAGDVCLIGGEDFPGLAWRGDAASIAARHPHLILLEIEGYPGDGPDAGRPAAELLVQARSGLTYEQLSDRPVPLAFAPASHCAALHGLTAIFAGLCDRAKGGGGQVLRTSLYEGALTLGTQYWMRATNPVRGFDFGIPKDPRQLIFACRDGRYIHVVLGSFGSKGSLYRILGIDDPNVKPEDSGIPTGKGDPKLFFGDLDLLAPHAAAFESDDLMAQLQAAGVPATFVTAPGECWGDPQVALLGVIETDGSGNRHVGLPLRGTLRDRATAPLTVPADRGAPLAGLRVLDFGIFVAGPYTGVALADLGADVIKVETPQGDPNRNIARSYAAANRGKRGIIVDLKTSKGREISDRLIASAQVVLNNFRPGVSARLGLDPASLHAADPDKIVLEATGFGRVGPDSKRPGFDMILQAYCGHELRAGGAGNPPMWDRTAMVDYVCGLIDQVAVLMAVWRRLEGRGGADLDSSLVDAGLLLMSELVRRPDGALEGAAQLDAERSGFHPAEALYPCSDGWIAITARGDDAAAALADTLGFAAPARAEWGANEAAAIRCSLQRHTAAEALALLREAECWAEACTTTEEAALRLAAATPGAVVTLPHPLFGEISQFGALFRMAGKRPEGGRGVPLAGEHSRAILAELGYSDTDVADFFDRKIVA